LEEDMVHQCMVVVEVTVHLHICLAEATAEDIEDALGVTTRTEQGQCCGKQAPQMFRRWKLGIMAFLCQMLQERRRFKTSKED